MSQDLSVLGICQMGYPLGLPMTNFFVSVTLYLWAWPFAMHFTVLPARIYDHAIHSWSGCLFKIADLPCCVMYSWFSPLQSSGTRPL